MSIHTHTQDTRAHTHQAVVLPLVCDLPLFPLAVQCGLVQVAQSGGRQQQQQGARRSQHPGNTERKRHRSAPKSDLSKGAH